MSYCNVMYVIHIILNSLELPSNGSLHCHFWYFDREKNLLEPLVTSPTQNSWYIMHNPEYDAEHEGNIKELVRGIVVGGQASRAADHEFSSEPASSSSAPSTLPRCTARSHR